MSRKIMLTLCLLVSSILFLNAVTLDGIVTEAQEGLPVAGAMLQLHSGNMNFYEATTNESGEFIFEDLAEGNYMLHIEAIDYEPYMEMLELNEDLTIAIELTETGGNGGGELTGHLFGTVSNEDGTPAPGLQMIISTWNQNTHPHFQEYETTTGEAGQYDFSEIVDFADYEVLIITGQQPWATEVFVEGETEYNIVIEEYEPGNLWNLSGTVTDSETGDLLPEIEIMIHSFQGYMMEAVTNEAGVYEFAALPEAEYELMVHGYNSGYETFSAQIELTDNTVFDIALIPLPEGELTLSGTVSNAQTGEIVPQVDIMLHGQGIHYSTISDDTGSYSFEGLFAGSYHIFVQTEGLNYFPFEAQIELEENMEFNIQLQEWATGELTLDGTIVNETGELLAELAVHLWSENTPGGHLMSITDENGYYEITGISPALYQLSVGSMHGYTLFETEIEILEDMTFDIVIETEPAEEGNLTGTVYNSESGESLPGIQIYIQHGWDTYETMSDDNGFYSFQNIPIQNYQIAAWAEGFQQFHANLEIDEETVFDINLEPYASGDYTLSGTVTDDVTGEFLQEVHIQMFAQQGMSYNAITDEEGHYQIEGIFAGTYQMMAWAEGWNEYHPFDAMIEIEENMVFDFTLQPFEIPETGNITGFVLDTESMEPISGAYLHLAPLNGSGGGCWGNYQTISEEDGSFNFAQVDEGDYILASEAEGYVFSYYNGASNPEEADVITVIENEVVTLEILLQPLVYYTVTGNVRDYNTGELLEGAWVKAFTTGSGCHHWAVADSYTDLDGNFSLQLPQGEYILSAAWGEEQGEEFMRQFYDHKQSPANADVVTVDQDIAGIDFDLASPEYYDNQISGTITVAGSVPANPVLVAAVSGDNQWEAAVVTDMFGNYLLENLPENGFYILAYEYNSVPTYYPGVIDFEEALLVTAQGNVTDIDFDLVLPESNGIYQVDGYVLNNSGNPVVNANVIIFNEAGEALSYAVTNSDGYYQVDGLPSGSLTGLATKVLYNSDQASINVTVTGQADFVIDPQATTDEDPQEVAPANFTLSNYPNPFNPTTTISFNLPQAGFTTLNIYNVTGQKIATLAAANLESGLHSYTWNGQTDKGNTASSGIYFFKLHSGNITSTNKMILMK